MQTTKHAHSRAQQRCIPPFVDRLLNEFGEEEHVGCGCVRLFFSHRSIRNMERSFGRQPVGLMKRYFAAYKIESSGDGTIVTTGWRTDRFKRR
jgi:hypothetical protein